MACGNGATVRIWGDKWIPRATTYKVQSPCRILEENAIAEELVEAGTGGWNLPLVQEIFNVPEATIISEIPLSGYRQVDKLIWRATTTGVFTVNSAYYLDIERKALKQGKGSRPSQEDTIWKILWSLKIPNSTNVFLWRAL